MAQDIQSLGYVQARISLIDYRGTDAHDQKHATDRTTLLIKRWAACVDKLQADRLKTIQCCEARPGKGDVASLVIVDRQQFDSLQEAIQGHVESIKELEQAIIKLDEIIATNGLGDGWLSDLKQRLGSAGSGIYQQKTNISKLLTFYTQKNPRMSPEDVLKIPDFAARRADADRIIKLDEEYLAKTKPIVNEIEGLLEGVGC